MNGKQDPKKRFSERVTWYDRFRPGYPPAVLSQCTIELGLTPDWVVADVGSGTGILTALFLQNGNRVYAIEPNREMRMAAEGRLSQVKGFISIPGSAEATTLKGHSIDLITVGQAFHWFDRRAALQEFRRILKSEGWVLLIWNVRNADGGPFMRAYEDLLARFAQEYSQVSHKGLDKTQWDDFFSAHGSWEFSNEQVLDWEGLQGRLLSSSYAPLPGHPRHQPMVAALRAIFRQFQQAGSVRFDYRTQVYYGRLA